MGGWVSHRDGWLALRRAATALIAGAGAALLAPSGLLAAGASPQMTPSPGVPIAVLAATPNPVQAGRPVQLDASRSSDPGGTIVHYTWDLDGNGVYETDTGARPSVTVRSVAPGPMRIGVRVVDGRGAAAESRLVVPVTAQPRPQSRPPQASAGGPASASGPGSTVPDPGAGGAAPRPVPRVAVRAAASGGVGIQNFAFHPGTMSITAGDTVTWTNQDSASHTATANDGSFDTGLLKQGQSASHTFTTAGTVAYVCAIHPFMHGTIVVAAASTGGGGSAGRSGGGSSSAGTSSGGGSTSSSVPSTGSAAGSTGATPGSSLPNTGLQLIWMLVLGAAMTAGGALLRYRTRRR